MRNASKFTRFETFVGISVALHLAAAVALVVYALLPKEKPPLNLATFELVGNPPKGNGGGSAATPQPKPETPVSEEESPAPPPPPPTTKPVPTPPPVEEKAMPVRPEKVAKTSPEKPKPATASSDPKSTTDSKSSAAAAAQQGTTGKPGKEGVLNGDTLSLGGGQGVPSAMGLWLSRVKYLVERNWRAPPGLAGVKQMPEVVFSVALDGRPSMAKMRQKSGNPTLDRLALRAVQSVDLFPPVPSAWTEDKVVLRYVLQYAP